MPSKGRAGPLPDATELALSRETTAIGRHGDGMPMLEANIGAVEVHEELRASLLGLEGGKLWGCLLNTVIGEMSITCQHPYLLKEGARLAR